MSRRILLATLACLVIGPDTARTETAPAVPVTVPELIAASRHAFDNRRYARADSLAETACAQLRGADSADPLEHATALVCLSRAPGQRAGRWPIRWRCARRGKRWSCCRRAAGSTTWCEPTLTMCCR